MQHKISIASCFDYDIPLYEQMKYITDTGFTHISLGSNLEHSRLFDDGRVEQIKNALVENSLRIDTIHFSQSLSTDNWQDIMDKTMQAACELNCPVIVVHPTSFMAREINSDEDVEKLKSSIDDLEILCDKHKINVALENLCIDVEAQTYGCAYIRQD